MRVIRYIEIAWFLTNNIFAKDLYYSDEFQIKLSIIYLNFNIYNNIKIFCYLGNVNIGK